MSEETEWLDDHGVPMSALCHCGHRNGVHSVRSEFCTICNCPAFYRSHGPYIFPQPPPAEYIYEQLREQSDD